jgi:hypothetical protein
MDGNYDDTAIVDMGADEYYWSKADFDANGVVHLIDYAMFANAWLTETGHPDYNDLYDLAQNYCIDSSDLALFCADWLWQAGWVKQQTFGLGRPRTSSMEKTIKPLSAELLSAEPESSQTTKTQPPQLTEDEIEQIEKFLEELMELWKTDPAFQQDIEEGQLLDFIDSVIKWLKEISD